MTGMNKELRRYCGEVSRMLPCKPWAKRKLMAEIQGDIIVFLEECPEADYSAIVRRFGTPQQIAASNLEAMEPQEVLRGLNIRKRIVGIIAAGIALVVLIWGVGVLISVVSFANSTGGYFEIYINP